MKDKEKTRKIIYVEPESYFPKEIRDKYFRDEERQKEVQAIILNLSVPKTLEEVLEIQRVGEGFDVEVLLSSANHKYNYNWTSPKWIKLDDIVFFMHSKRSVQTIARLRNQLKRESNRFTPEEQEIITKGLERGRELCSKYAGKIFFVARVSGTPMYVDPEELKYDPHWKSRVYVYVEDGVALENPVDLSEFNSFIKLSCGGSITPVFGDEYTKLRDLIQSKNNIPECLKTSIAMPIPLAKIDRTNWISVAYRYRYHFLYENQFRVFYVDYLLKEIGDRRTIFRECACKKNGKKDSFVDNVILFNDKYLPVEVKLSVKTEPNLKKQVHKYCNLDILYLDKKDNRIAPLDRVYRNNVLVIDTEAIYLYNDEKSYIKKVFDLDDLIEREDLECIRDCIMDALGN